MSNGIRWVGLDVHATQTAAAVFDSASGEVRARKFAGRPHEVLAWLSELPVPVRAVYEAGPTGYGTRTPRTRGRRSSTCRYAHRAWSPRHPATEIKTDKRDALKLARLHAAGQLVLVHVPKLEHEQLRDLARCREDVRADLMRARHRIGKYLLRREIYFISRGRGGGRAWTREHREWLASLRFTDRASELTFADYLHAHDVLLARRDTLDRAIDEIARDSPWAPIIGRLRCLHGIDTLSGVRDLRRSLRLRALPQPDGVQRLPRPGPVRAHIRRQAPPRRDHQGRLRPRPPLVGRSRPPLRAPAQDRRGTAASPGRPPAVGDRPLLARSSDACTPAGVTCAPTAAAPAA